MSRLFIPLFLLLGSCANAPLAKAPVPVQEFPMLLETGAPPRPRIRGQIIKVTYLPRDKMPASDQGWVVLGQTRVVGNTCYIELLDALGPLTFDRALSHELRHCAGQGHKELDLNGNTVVVWMP